LLPKFLESPIIWAILSEEFSMPRWLLPCVVLLAVAACTHDPQNVAQFWRPISEPNIQLPLGKAQNKLDYDLSQCRCGIYPTNVPQADISTFDPGKQRLAETSETVTPDDQGQCVTRPSLVVSECMRSRGWEVTNCFGRMPLPGGGSLCAAYVPDANK
jgi:hypothetical protein